MKINSMTNYPAIFEHKPKYGLESKVSASENAENCNYNNVNRGYCGSFTGKEKAAASFYNKITDPIKNLFSIDTLNKINKLCKDHKSITQSIVALVLTAVFRPLSIISLPGKKNKDDKTYAASHSIASGLIGFAASWAVMSPLDGSAHKWGKKADIVKERLLKRDEEITNAINNGLEVPKRLTKKEALKGVEVLGEKFLDIFGEFKDGELIKLDRRALEKTTSVLEMLIDTFGLGVAKAALTIALIPPILKYVFGVEKSKSPKVVNNINSSPILNKPDITKFLGGNK